MKKTICLSLLTFSFLFADAQTDELKEQLKQQETSIENLATQVEMLNQKNQQAVNTSASFSQNAYLPDIALIVNMSALSRDVKNSDYETYAIPGFIDSGDAEIEFNKDKGFNLNYAELAIGSTVNPYFDAFSIFHISPDGIEIEEAFVKTRALAYGFSIKAGKFKSDFGRVNSKHQHAWNFDSQALIYESLFGPEAISDPGLQVQWIAPTDSYIVFGLEAMQGSGDMSFGNTEKNNLYIGYLKSSIDIGENISLLGGISMAHGENTLNNSINPTDIYGVDLTVRTQLSSYSTLIWQSEYLYRNKDIGTSTNDKQAGLYSELLYQANINWVGGIRYDLITQNDTDLTAYSGIDTDNLDRYTAKIDYMAWPMSRLRLAYTYDKTKVIAGQRKDINEVLLSLNIAIGAHAAHNY